jgi:hypothetical protein
MLMSTATSSQWHALLLRCPAKEADHSRGRRGEHGRSDSQVVLLTLLASSW